jgi:hypothetical protein
MNIYSLASTVRFWPPLSCVVRYDPVRIVRESKLRKLGNCARAEACATDFTVVASDPGTSKQDW